MSERLLPMLVTCEHATNRVPENLRRWFTDAAGVLRSHRGWDPGALDIATSFAAQFAAPLLVGAVSRLVVELNRSEHHRALFSEFVAGLDEADREAILERYYRPFRDAALEQVQRSIKTGGRVLHLSVHTFTPALDGVEREVDIGLLYDPGREHERLMCALWRRALAARWPDLRIRLNQPYLGKADGHTTALRRRFTGDAYLGIEIEVNQALIRRPAAARARGEVLAESLREALESTGLTPFGR